MLNPTVKTTPADFMPVVYFMGSMLTVGELCQVSDRIDPTIAQCNRVMNAVDDMEVEEDYDV